MGIPRTPIGLMNKVYREVFPVVQEKLHEWKQEAKKIPDPELRMQAISSIEQKEFHCEGGSILTILAEEKKNEAISFVVAYQTISDYLDNLCDRSTSMDDKDFAALHESMVHSLSLCSEETNYYRYRLEQDDGGYLNKLVETCQQFWAGVDNYTLIEPHLKELCSYYVDLQVHKHVVHDEREERLNRWFAAHKSRLPEMAWYEFSACSGSTLGIFCLVSYALRDDFNETDADRIRNGYFPYIQGLHILLDYFIDQEEDMAEGDLNFCSYYDSNEQMFKRMAHFVSEAESYLNQLPHKGFHLLIHRGLLGLYLSDKKVEENRETKSLAWEMVKLGGPQSRFFYRNAKLYRFVKRLLPRKYALATHGKN
ncbi:MAG: tetraprenyl-beta-curcumene synthase family protein [Bacillus sp. (in: firmicutes)]